MIITIDGPAGAGKSTIAQKLAQRLKSRYLESGSIYRVITLKALAQDIDSLTDQDLVRLVKQSRIQFKPSPRKLKVWLDGKDVTRRIRSSSITNQVYKIANNPVVRKALVKFQRSFGKCRTKITQKGISRHPVRNPNKILSSGRGNLVAEGRDMGSVIFPKADFKFYLDASVNERAQRRYKELLHQGRRVKLSQIASEIKRRDTRDKTRKVAPLIKTKDAIYVDTTKLTINQVVNRLLTIIKER